LIIVEVNEEFLHPFEGIEEYSGDSELEPFETPFDRITLLFLPLQFNFVGLSFVFFSLPKLRFFLFFEGIT
jgi:hypothetical protein